VAETGVRSFCCARTSPRSHSPNSAREVATRDSRARHVRLARGRTLFTSARAALAALFSFPHGVPGNASQRVVKRAVVREVEVARQQYRAGLSSEPWIERVVPMGRVGGSHKEPAPSAFSRSQPGYTFSPIAFGRRNAKNYEVSLKLHSRSGGNNL